MGGLYELILIFIISIKEGIKMKKHYVLIIIVALVLCFSVAQSATAASAQEEVMQAVGNFIKAVNTSDYDLMSSIHLHSHTISKYYPGKEGAFISQGWEAFSITWKGMLADPPGTYMISPHNQQVTMLGNNVALVTQYFIYRYTNPTTKAQEISQFRSSLVFQKIKGEWLIVHEHTSEFPVE